MMSTSRRQFLASAGVASLAGCTGSGLEGEIVGTDGSADPTATEDSGGDGAVPTAARRLPLPMAPEKLREEARSGGPSKDGIPAIDAPKFIDGDEEEFLRPGDPVFGVARDGAVKAYPQKILVQHEIVNDVLAGDPISVTYCPLTGTVQGFERGETTFGVSGRLINNNLVMYDRATETWWPQMLATSIPGPWNEDPPIESLREFRLIWTTWEQWKAQHPDTEVLSTETGYAHNYGRDPYGSYNPRRGYYDSKTLLFPPLDIDDRFRKKRIVMGARTPEGAAAFLKDTLQTKRLVTGEIGTTPVIAVFDPRYETASVYRNPEGLEFEIDDGTVVSPDGTPQQPHALSLERVHTFDAMWFAWAGYYPDANVYE